MPARSSSQPLQPRSAPQKRLSARVAPSPPQPRPTFTKLVQFESGDDVSPNLETIIADPASGFVQLYDRQYHEITEDFCAKDVCGPGGQRQIKPLLVVLTMERMHHDLFDIISKPEHKMKMQSVVNNKARLIKEVGGYLKHLATNYGYIYSDIKPENVGLDFDEKSNLTRIRLLDYGSEGAFTIRPTFRKIGRQDDSNIFVIAALNFAYYVAQVHACDDMQMLGRFQQNRFEWIPTQSTAVAGKISQQELKLKELKERYEEFRTLSEGTVHPETGEEETQPLTIEANFVKYTEFIQDVINMFQPRQVAASVKRSLNF